MPPPLPEILDNLRRASVQHGAAIKSMLEDIQAIGTDLKAVLARQKETDEAIAAIGRDLATLATGESPEGLEPDPEADDDEEDAEYEEAGG